ncbi:hypothetical protein KP509_29G037700 [Ceratopteris richardii]|nr:hypothetical protein KP509_29G037700 [Ceratopteris richardii]
MKEDKVNKPWERHDGFSVQGTVLAEGGVVVPEAIVLDAVEAYENAISEVKGRGAWKENKTHFPGGSVGSFIQKGLDLFLAQQRLGGLGLRSSESDIGHGWDLPSIQESVFHMNMDRERIDCACNSFFDLDLETEKEYEEFPGIHSTIPGGYTTVLQEMERSLPPGTVQLNKKVAKVLWNSVYPSLKSPVAIYCEDGCVVEADHVIITVSLGILKSVTTPISTMPLDVCRSVDELNVSLHKKQDLSQLFEPSLPHWKLESISRLGFGLVNKLFLLVDPSVEERFKACIELIHRRGKASSGSSVPWWMRKTFSFEPIYEGSRVILCWLAGSEALQMETLTDEEVLNGVVETMASFGMHHGLGDIRTDDEEKHCLRKLFRGILRSKWGTNPLCRGSYTYVATGASGADIDALAEPLPRKPQSYLFLQSDFCVEELPPISRTSSTSIVSTLSLGSSSYASSSSSEQEVEDLEAFGDADSEERPLQLLFAGEATHRQLYTTTHGAFLSGVREADRLLRHHKFCV